MSVSAKPSGCAPITPKSWDIRTAIPAAPRASAAVRRRVMASPRKSTPKTAANSGMVKAMMTAWPAPIIVTPKPMKTNQLVMLNSAARHRRGHSSRGDFQASPDAWPAATASPSSSRPAAIPLSARNSRTETSETMIFIIGQLMPQPRATPISRA